MPAGRYRIEILVSAFSLAILVACSRALDARPSGSSGSGECEVVLNETASLVPIADGMEQFIPSMAFGYEVHTDGDRLVVGAPAVQSTERGGSVHVYERHQATGEWLPTTVLTAPIPAVGDQFGVRVRIDGNTLAVSSPGRTVNGFPQAGAVYVFVCADGGWSLQATLDEGDLAGQSHLFGQGLDLEGDRLVVGSQHTGGGCSTGRTFVYLRSGTAWSAEGMPLLADDGRHNDAFGNSVALFGDTLVVGAPGHTHDANPTRCAPEPSGEAGAAYVFTRDASAGEWVQRVELNAGGGSDVDQFGYAVDIWGTTIVVGAFHATSRIDPSALMSGVVHVFVGDGGTWTEEAILEPCLPELAGVFGFNLSLDGDRLAVSAIGYGEPNSGTAYVFFRSGGCWSALAQFADSISETGENFGHGIALAGDWVLVGAEHKSAGPSSMGRGAAFVYDVPSLLAGNVNTGSGGSPIDVLFVNGSAGGATREVGVVANAVSRLDILHPPSLPPGRAHYGVWILDGVPSACDATEIRFLDKFGVTVTLGLGARCLPINNSVSADACPCPMTFPAGFTSMSFGSQTARRFCLNARPGHDLAPEHFFVRFPTGDFTIGGVVLDRNAPASPETNIAVANWIIVRSRP